MAERDPGARPTGAVPERQPAGQDARAERADVRARLERAEALVEHAPDAIVILDVDLGRFVWVNAAAEQLFGMDREALLRVGPVEVSPPVQPDGRRSETAAREYLALAIAGARPRFEWLHRRTDGRDVPCEITLLRLPAADQRLVRGSVLEITERREAERARKDADAAQAARRAAEANAARLQAMVAGLNAIVWERDPDTLRIRFINQRAEELLGYPTAQWLEDDGLAERIIHPDDHDRALETVRSAVAEGSDFSLSYRVRAADGRWLWLQHLGHVDRDEDGAGRALHAVLIDVTESRRREQAAALLAAAGRVLAGGGSVEGRLAAVAQLAVGEVCDRASVWLREGDGRYRPVAAAPPEVASLVMSLAPVRTTESQEAAYRAGRPFVVPEVSDEMRRTAAEDEAHYRAVAALDTRSVLVAPLIADRNVVGLLTLVAAHDGRRYDDTDLALAADLGQRLATMVAGERLAAQRRQLNELTEALSAAGTVAEAAAAVTAGLRRALGASVVSVCILGADGLLHAVDMAGYPHGERRTRYLVRGLTEPFPLTDAARTHRAIWLHDRAELIDRYPAVVPDLQEQTQAVAALPLLVGDRLVGALSATFRTPRRFDAEERALLLTIAGQIAVAFERAALADVRREMAETLQRSLLPGDLPHVDRLAVTARYLPAVTGTQAGGDWYDVLPLGDRGVAVAVGDVIGNGAPAAAVMGQLRSALAGLLLAGFGPARALEVLDRFAGQISGARVSTVACLRIEPDTGRLTYSRAGHPPPLRVDAGDGAGPGSYLEGGLGPALGLPTSNVRPEASITLAPGATLVLYTDGLVERRGATLDDGLDRLAAAVTVRRSAALPALVDGVLGELVDGDGATDDIAVVAVRLLPAPLRLDLPGEPVQLSRVRQMVGRWALGAGLDPDAVEDLQLALGEAAGNAVEHAYRDASSPGRVIIELGIDHTGDVAVSVTDAGTWRPVPSDPGSRGRGLQVISALARDVDLDIGPGGTTVRFLLPPAAAAAEAPRRRAAAQESPGGRPAGLAATEAHGRRCLELTGDLDLAGAAAVREPLLAELAAGRPVTLDLTRLGFVTSVGVGLLLEAARTAGDLEALLPPAGPARRLLDLTGLTGVLQGLGRGESC